MLARLAHATTHHRKAIILAWLALTIFGGFAAAQVSQRWLQSFSIPGYSGLRGEPADARSVRHRRSPPERRRVQNEGRRDQERSDSPRRWNERSRPVRVRGRARSSRQAAPRTSPRTGTRPSWSSTRPARRTFDAKSGAEAILAAATTGLPTGIDSPRHGPRRDHGGEPERRDGRPERPRRGADRRPRRARHPLLRLRNAARGPAADRDRGVVDPQHLHARLAPHLRHRRVDHRAVPDRARRPRCRDRLRVAHDLPLPRRAARGRETWRRHSSRR